MKHSPKNPPLDRVPGQPQGEDDMINRFGTYEVQTACDLENPMPSIGQEACPERPKSLGK